ncbi:MAG: 6,7-dimethyl-8-ribityllumazine synthase [Rhodospirillaceae bacterium]|jgi:6,7-dimethyl-8-ribityllumazine synthase|nr:6,7-dimethyl-8-ribityllumazine synthase [Rhodospirillaceae bacterium]MBT6118023.1 6,7-dimethyl-8-ribityllumazine synthase [Rhodospirillaceae bacterium]
MSDVPHIMIVEAPYYTAISESLRKGALRAIEAAGATWELFSVPGAFEIPAAIRFALRSRDFSTRGQRFDGYVALGCVIRGETSHYDYVCGESARGLQDLALEHTLAIGYGILTVENEDQAWARADLEGRDKGGEAARACLEMIALKKAFGLFPR